MKKVKEKEKKKSRKKMKWNALSFDLSSFLSSSLSSSWLMFVCWFCVIWIMMIKKKEEINIRIMRGSVTLFVQCVFDFSLHFLFFFVHSFSHLFLMFSHHVWCFWILRNDQRDVLFVFHSHSYSRPQNLIWSEVFSFKDYVIHVNPSEREIDTISSFLSVFVHFEIVDSNFIKQFQNETDKQSINWSFTQTHFVLFCFRHSIHLFFFSKFFLFSKNNKPYHQIRVYKNILNFNVFQANHIFIVSKIS